MKKLSLVFLVAAFSTLVLACNDQSASNETATEEIKQADLLGSNGNAQAESNLVSNMKTEETEDNNGDNAAPVVVLETSMGNIEIELNPTAAPVSTENFLSYVEEGFYDGLIFHRVISNFMIQGGGFDEQMVQKKTKDPITNEAGNGLKNDIYTIAMARTNVINSATSQFFINVKNNDFLNHRDESPQGFGYAVFGVVTEGQDVVDKIKMVPTGISGGHRDVPTKPVVIIKAYKK